MTLNELSSFFNSFLKNEEYDRDISLNGVQVQNSAPDTKEIKKVAFAVDACLETIKRTIQADAQLLFTHHGIFWGSCDTITGSLYNRIVALIQNDVALYASHIPLDANNPYGNNFGMASRLELKDTQPFGTWRGMTLGAIGNLEKPLTADELIAKAFPHGNHSLHLLPFGKEKLSRIAIISGGAGEDVEQAIEAGADAFITGEVGHEQYHVAEENGITLIAGGHYETETVGVQLVKAKLEAETDVEGVFIDVPTGL